MFRRFFGLHHKQFSRPFITHDKNLKHTRTGYSASFLSFRTANLVFASCISLGLFATPQVGFSSSRGLFVANEGIDTAAIIKSLKTDSTYNSSVVLYGASLLNDSALFSKALSDFDTQILAEKDESFIAWMLGRKLLALENMLKKLKSQLLAAKNMQDDAAYQNLFDQYTKTVQSTLDDLHRLLQDPNLPKNEFRAWALGYLAAFNSEEYHANKEEMLNAAKALSITPEPSTANVLWAHVMNLQAAAREKDEPTFKLILDEMKKFTHKATVEEALAQIPENDWQAWAIGIATESAALMGEVDLYHSLRQSLSPAIDNAANKANAMLAQISANTVDTLMQSQQTTKLLTP